MTFFKRKSSWFFLLIATQALALCLLAVHGHAARAAAKPVLLQKRALVRSCAITDLCLFTEARYTRHPAMADIHSPFQDGPLSFEHFPSGSLLPPLFSPGRR